MGSGAGRSSAPSRECGTNGARNPGRAPERLCPARRFGTDHLLPREPSNPRGSVSASFDRAAAGDLNLVVSTITLAEAVSGPLAAGNEYLAEQYRLAMTRGPGLAVVAVTETIAVTAARFRARYRLRLPDAIQLATAVEVGAYALVTHDHGFRRVEEVRISGQALSRK